MLDILKFVQGAVAKKDFVQALRHFRIQNGRIIGFNGGLGLSAPIDLDIDAAPKADQFVRAISACEEQVTITQLDAQRLQIRSGKFRTTVDCIPPETFPDLTPDGVFADLTNDFIPALRDLLPFIAIDASRPWACGILLKGHSAFATNNLVLAQYWLGYEFPVEVNIPHSAVKELVRIGEAPTKIQLTSNRAVFHYSDGKWVSTQLYTAQWPDVGPMFDRPSNQSPIAAGMFDTLEKIAPFTDELGKVFFNENQISTASPENQTTATVYECTESPGKGVYNIHQLINLRDIIKTVDFNMYPGPVLFYGTSIRGLLVGFRQ